MSEQIAPEFPFTSIDDVVHANHNAGFHFFDDDTLRAFRSRIGQTLHAGRYFVTSEVGPAEGSRRRWTIREVKPDARIVTVGHNGAYASSQAASREAARLAAAVETTKVVHVTQDGHVLGVTRTPRADGNGDLIIVDGCYQWRKIGPNVTAGQHRRVSGRTVAAAARNLRLPGERLVKISDRGGFAPVIYHVADGTEVGTAYARERAAIELAKSGH